MPWSEQVYRWCRRNRLVTGLMFVTVLLLVAVTGSALWGYIQTSEALGEAQGERARAVSHLYHSLVREARTLRLARVNGYRSQAWALLQQAGQLDTSDRDVEELRQEAAACLGDFVGLEPAELTGFLADVRAIALAPRSRFVSAPPTMYWLGWRATGRSICAKW